MKPSRRIPALALGGTFLAASALVGATAVAAQQDQTYRFTIVNLTPGQPLTPPIFVIHNDKTSIVQAGAAASAGIVQVAENGNNQPLLDALATDSNVFGVGTGTTPVVAGGVPGAAEFPGYAQVEVSTSKKGKLFSAVAMEICTNDGFAIAHDVALPKKVGQAIVVPTDVYDAGSETNTEDFANMVPPCQALVGVTSGEAGTGESDPALAENGVITPHTGIAGTADLDPTIHAVATMAALPVLPAIIVVERIS